MATVKREPAERPIPFEQFIADPAAIFDDMERDGQPVVVERDGKSFTLRPSKARRRKKTGIILPDDPLWTLMGAGDSGEPNNNVARDKHRYIAEALAAHKIPAARPSRTDDNGDASPDARTSGPA